MRRIMVLVTVAAVMAAMIATSAIPAAAQVTGGECPPGMFPGFTNPSDPTAEEGCGTVLPPGGTCPQGTEQVGPGFCWGPYLDSGPELTKEACKENFVALGYENQGQCIKAANEAAQAAG